MHELETGRRELPQELGLWWPAGRSEESAAGGLRYSEPFVLLERLNGVSDVYEREAIDLHGIVEGRPHTLLGARLHKARKYGHLEPGAKAGYQNQEWGTLDLLAGAHVTTGTRYRIYGFGRSGLAGLVNFRIEDWDEWEDEVLIDNADVRVTLSLRGGERSTGFRRLTRLYPVLIVETAESRTLSDFRDQFSSPLAHLIDVITGVPGDGYGEWVAEDPTHEGPVTRQDFVRPSNLEINAWRTPSEDKTGGTRALLLVEDHGFGALCRQWLELWPQLWMPMANAAPNEMKYYIQHEVAVLVGALEALDRYCDNSRTEGLSTDRKRTLSECLTAAGVDSTGRAAVYKALQAADSETLAERLQNAVADLGPELEALIFPHGTVNDWAVLAAEVRNVVLHGLRRSGALIKDYAVLADIIVTTRTVLQLRVLQVAGVEGALLTKRFAWAFQLRGRPTVDRWDVVRRELMPALRPRLARGAKDA